MVMLPFISFIIISDMAFSESDDKELELGVFVSNTSYDNRENIRFEISIKNISDLPLRVLNVSDRPDLQYFYFDIIIVNLDGGVDYPPPFANPAPINENDYIVLKSGESLALSAIPYLTDVRTLAKGRYKAYVRYMADPMADDAKFYISPEVRFSIQ